MQGTSQTTNISATQPTIIQVSKSTPTTTILQNGQHLLIGKLEQSTTNGVENQSTSNTTNGIPSIYPLQYIEAAVVSANTNQSSNDVNTTTVYGTTGNKIYYQDNHGSTIYTSMSGQTATIIPASTIQARDITTQLGSTVGGTVHLQTAPHAQIVHHGGNAYLVQSTSRLEDESPNLSHTTKASPVTVQWLCDNYETADGVSLPRSTLYNHYLQHCQQEKLEPMNQASFGKLIRSVFFGLRTRRLGTRGNSKYHYYGIRIKPNSPLNHYVEDQTFAMRQYPSFHRQNVSDYHWRSKYSNNCISYGGNNLVSGGISGSSQTNVGGGSGSINSSAVLNMNNSSASLNDLGNNQHSNYLGESTSALPNLEDIMSRAELDALTDEECLGHAVTMDEINLFCHMYLDHSDNVLSAVVYLNFKYIETLWQDFWRTSPKTGNQWEEKLSKVQLHRLLKMNQVQKFLQLFDNVFYQSLVEVLIPNVLRPIPSALTQNIRHFAKSLESWMAAATTGLNQDVVQIKMSCVCALAQTLRRHTSLNHLAQAARAVLKNASQINQMLTDLNRVDFSNVQEQASWVCGCDNKRVDTLQQDFKRILQQQASLEEWASWLDQVVNDVLEPYKSTAQYPAAAHQFILKWSFYSSMVIRDLTLRSAASFGSFHLIRLLYDEYIYYLVEQKVAEHLDLTPVAVTGEMGRQLMSGDCSSYDLQVDFNESKQDIKMKQKFSKKESDVINNTGGSIELDYRSSGISSSAVDSNQSSAYNNSSSVGDSQVEEAADNECTVDFDTSVNSNDIPHTGSTGTGSQMAQQSSATHQSQENRLGTPLISVRPATVTHHQKSNESQHQQQMSSSNTSTTVGIVAASSTMSATTPRVSSIVGVTSIRKTVNVTTFGDPPPVSSVTGPSSMLSISSGSGDISSLTSTNKISIVNNPSLNSCGYKTSPTLSKPSSSSTAALVSIDVAAPQSSSTTAAAVVSSISTNFGGAAPANKRIKLLSSCSLPANNVTGSSS